MLELKKEFTIVIVTHNMAQAARISDYSLFMYLGESGRIRPHAKPVHHTERSNGPKSTSPASSDKNTPIMNRLKDTVLKPVGDHPTG